MFSVYSFTNPFLRSLLISSELPSWILNLYWTKWTLAFVFVLVSCARLSRSHSAVYFSMISFEGLGIAGLADIEWESVFLSILLPLWNRPISSPCGLCLYFRPHICGRLCMYITGPALGWPWHLWRAHGIRQDLVVSSLILYLLSVFFCVLFGRIIC